VNQNLSKVNSDFIDSGLKVLTCLENAYNHPENYQVLSSSRELLNRYSHPQCLPQEGAEAREIIEEAIAAIFSGYCNVSHPQYYGYISPKPLPISLVGDLLASGLNQTPGAWRAGPAATVIEAETLQWISQFIGYENNIGKVPNGIFTSGGSMANASALKLARDIILGRDLQDKGLVENKFKPTVYMSEEGHFSIWKGLDFLGLGRNCLRRIAVDENGRINLNALQQQIQQDIQIGAKPICLIATAGTSATGSVDPISSLASIARDYDMWFHVDAAAGGVFANLAATKKHFEGINLADSVTIDPCKWLFVPFGIGCLLTKDGSELVKSFQASGHYWEELSEPDLFQMGLPGTRQWRSLGLWMTFKYLGSNGYGELLSNALSTVFYLAEKIQGCEQLELLQQPTLPVCCFRIKNSPQHLSLDEINRLVQKATTDTGNYYITLLDWRKTSYFRVSINNFSTNREHIDSLIDAILNQLKFFENK